MKVITAVLQTAITLPGSGISGDLTIDSKHKHPRVNLSYDELGLHVTWSNEGVDFEEIVPSANVKNVRVA